MSMRVLEERERLGRRTVECGVWKAAASDFAALRLPWWMRSARSPQRGLSSPARGFGVTDAEVRGRLTDSEALLRRNRRM